MGFCKSQHFLRVFEGHIKSTIKHFKGATEGTYRVEWLPLFEDYLDLFYNTLAEFIQKNDGDVQNFFDECHSRKVNDTGTSDQKHFTTLLEASCSFSDWKRIMIKEAEYYFASGRSHFGNVSPEMMKMDKTYQDPRFKERLDYGNQ